MKILKTAVVLFLGAWGYSNAFAAVSPCESHSSSFRTPLLELYTSEGCSSCPPADKWMSGLVPDIAAKGEIVPLAFHVDYWDRLGWKDRFADAAYTARQYSIAKFNGSRYVFTPQVVIGGRNFPAWSNKQGVQEEIRKTLASKPGASITLRQHPSFSNKLEFEIQIQTSQQSNSGNVHAYVVLYQNSLFSEVLRGENGGSQLHHDYVARGLLVSDRIDLSGNMIFRNKFNLPPDTNLESMGVAVFVQDIKSGNVLQAMAAPLCGVQQQ